MSNDSNDTKQQLEKDRMKEAAASADKAKPRCSICGKYADKKTLPQCFGGHDAGGVGSSGSSEESASKSVDPQPQSGEKPFNLEIIPELLSKRLLLIEDDRKLNTLTIQLLCNPKDLSPEQRDQFEKFVDTISKELEEFKKENGIANNCKLIEKDKEGNLLSLRIELPTSLYDKFIQRLASKNLFSIQNINQQNTSQERSSIRPRSPLDGLKPKGL